MKRLVLLAAAVATLAACGDQTASPDGEGSLLPTDRLALPEMDLAGFRELLVELRGTPVVVNIWGSWCPPCELEAPELAEVSKEFEGRVQFVGIDILDNRIDARAFIRRFDWPYPSVFDPLGAIRDGLGYIGQPVTLIYDRAGSLVSEWNGAVDRALLLREIGRVL